MKPGEVIEVVKCKFCGGFTQMLNTQLCDSCWEISSRIGHWTLWQHIKCWWRHWE